MDLQTFADVDTPISHMENGTTTSPSLDHVDPFWIGPLLNPFSNIISPDIPSLLHPSQESTAAANAASPTPIRGHFFNGQCIEQKSIDDTMNIGEPTSGDEGGKHETTFETMSLNDFKISENTNCDQQHSSTPSLEDDDKGQEVRAHIDPSRINHKWSNIFEHAYASSSHFATQSPKSPTSVVATTLAAAALKPSVVPIPITQVLQNNSVPESQSTGTKRVKAKRKGNKQPRKMSKREAAKAATAAAISEEIRLAHLAKTKQITDDELLRLKPKKKRRAAKFDKPIPSRFCHICSRTPKSVRLAVCSKIKFGTCRKVICEKCFVKYGYGDFEDALKTNETGWLCPHCNDTCPARAQCRTYQRINDRLRVTRLKQECPRRRSLKPSNCSSVPKSEVTTANDGIIANDLTEGMSSEPKTENQSYEAMVLEEDALVQCGSSAENVELEEGLSDVPFQPPTQFQNVEAGQDLYNLLSIGRLVPPLQITNEAIFPTSEVDYACYQQASGDVEPLSQGRKTCKENSITRRIGHPPRDTQALDEVMPTNEHAVEYYDDQLWRNLNLSSVGSFCGGIGGSTPVNVNEEITSSFPNKHVMGSSDMLSQFFNIEDIRGLHKLDDIGQTINNIDTVESAKCRDFGGFLGDSGVVKVNDTISDDLVLDDGGNRTNGDDRVEEEEDHFGMNGTS